VAVFEYSQDGINYSLIEVDNESYDGFSATWDTTKVPDGEYKLRVTITDLWNTTASSEIRVWVDNEQRLPRTLRVPQAFLTIQDALAFARPGDTIIVDASIVIEAFIGPILIDIPKLTIESVNGEAIIDGQKADEVVRITSNFVVFKGFKVVNGRKGIALTGDNCTLANNIVSGNNYGIDLSGAQRNLIVNNIARNNGFMGIVLNGANNNTLRGNIVEGNGEEGPPFDSAGIALILSYGNLLEDNVVQRNKGFSTPGISLRENSRKNILRSNIVKENSEGVELDLVDMNFLEGNIVTHNSVGINVWLADSNQLTNNVVENNGVGLSIDGNNNVVQYNTIKKNETGIDLGLWIKGNSILHNDITDNDTGINAEFSTPFWGENTNVVHYNNITRNTIGVIGPDEGILDATDNWWGDSSGPYDPKGDEEVPPCHDNPGKDKNADGIGDKVIEVEVGNIDYCPWLVTPVEIPKE